MTFQPPSSLRETATASVHGRSCPLTRRNASFRGSSFDKSHHHTSQSVPLLRRRQGELRDHTPCALSPASAAESSAPRSRLFPAAPPVVAAVAVTSTSNPSRDPMPLPRRLAKFNRIATNRVLGPLARHLPGFAIVSHVGRRSGRTYRTPVNLFRHGDRYVIVLMYGADSQWVRNVLAAGGADIETRGRRLHVVGPEVVRDPARSLVPKPVRVPVGLANVDEFMLLKRADTDAEPSR